MGWPKVSVNGNQGRRLAGDADGCDSRTVVDVGHHLARHGRQSGPPRLRVLLHGVFFGRRQGVLGPGESQRHAVERRTARP